jgi:hypothetical protein
MQSSTVVRFMWSLFLKRFIACSMSVSSVCFIIFADADAGVLYAQATPGDPAFTTGGPWVASVPLETIDAGAKKPYSDDRLSVCGIEEGAAELCLPEVGRPGDPRRVVADFDCFKCR